MDPKDLVAKLREQHRKLYEDLSLALECASKNDPEQAASILNDLVLFKADLGVHLKLENGTFYPDYFEKKNALHEDSTYAHELVTQMSCIAESVITFLDKYSTIESIVLVPRDFAFELKNIISTLKGRIAVEDDLFEIYLMM